MEGFDWSSFFSNNAGDLLKGGADIFGAFQSKKIMDEQLRTMTQNRQQNDIAFKQSQEQRARRRNLHF